MTDYLLLRWVLSLLKGVCFVNPAARVGCVVLTIVGWNFWDAEQSAKAPLQFEQKMALLREIEAMKQADHKRLMEILEALKPRRDLTLPAEPDEGF